MGQREKGSGERRKRDTVRAGERIPTRIMPELGMVINQATIELIGGVGMTLYRSTSLVFQRRPL